MEHCERPSEADDRLAHLLESITDGLVSLDREWRYTYINARAEQALGRPRAHLLGKCLWDEYPASLGTEVERQLRRSAAEGVASEFRGYDPVQDRWYDNRVFPMPDGGVEIFFHDVTERTRAENARAALAAIVESSEDAIISEDLDGIIRSWNRGAERLYGYTAHEIVGAPLTILLPPDRVDELSGLIERIRGGERISDFETVRRRKDGSHVDVSLTISPVKNDAGQITGMSKVARNISDRKQAEKVLRATEKQQAADLAHMARLQEVSTRLVQSGDSTLLLLEIVDAAISVTAADMSNIQLLNHATGVLEIVASRGFGLPFLKYFNEIHEGQAACGTALKSRARVVIDDVTTSPVFVGTPALDVLLAAGVRAVQCTPLLSRSGNLLGMLSTHYRTPHRPADRDLHLVDLLARQAADWIERTQAEDDLRIANTRLDLAVRGLGIGIWEMDLESGLIPRGDVRFQNVWERLGYSGRDIPTSHAAAMSLVHPADRGRFDRAMTAYLIGGAPEFEAEVRVRRKDGRFAWILKRGVAVRDVTGRPIRFSGTDLDITDRKHAEEALRESEQRFRGTFENAAVGIAHIDADARYLRVNQTYCNILGYRPAFLLGTCCLLLAHPEDQAVGVAQFTALMRGEVSSFTCEKRYVHKDGSTVWVDMFVALQRDPWGRPDYAIEVVDDITDRKCLELELRQAKEVAEAANRAKDEFLANVSHEIRTPMNAILGMTEVLLTTPVTGDQKYCLQTIGSAADNLLGMINDLLDFSKIEAGKLALDQATFAIRAWLSDALRALDVQARAKGIGLTYHVEPDVPDTLAGDAARLRQVLFNLVGNAVKFTESGEVAVHVSLANRERERPESLAPDAHAPGSLELRFTVRDTGIGIAPAKQHAIFRAFEQEDMSTTRRYGGTGLGLTIAARLVSLMGGSIAVDSQPGHGSTFIFTARVSRPVDAALPPAAPAVRRDLTAAPVPAAAPRRILVAEDNELNSRHLQRLLTWLGHRVQTANNGRETLERLRVADRGPWVDGAPPAAPFDLLLLDLHMPELDGFAVVRAIREQESLWGGHLPVIALTARSRTEDRERCLAAGMDEYLAKPVRTADLIANIDRVARQARQPTTRPRAHESLVDPGVLLAACGDDSTMLAELIQDLRTYAPGRLREVRDAHRERDAPRLREAAHKLRGLLAPFSSRAGDEASQLEDQAAGSQLDEAGVVVRKLEMETAYLIRELEGVSVEGLHAADAMTGR